MIQMPYGEEDEKLRAYTQLVRRCIRPYFLRGGDHDDLFQEGTLGLLSAMRTFDPALSDNFEAYAVLCIKRRVIDAIRRDSALADREDLVRQQVSGVFDVKDVLNDPEVSFLANETANEIQANLSGMLSPFEVAVLGPFLDGYTSSEIADMLHRERKAVENAIKRIRRKLTRYLSERR